MKINNYHIEKDDFAIILDIAKGDNHEDYSAILIISNNGFRLVAFTGQRLYNIESPKYQKSEIERYYTLTLKELKSIKKQGFEEFIKTENESEKPSTLAKIDTMLDDVKKIDKKESKIKAISFYDSNQIQFEIPIAIDFLSLSVFAKYTQNKALYLENINSSMLFNCQYGNNFYNYTTNIYVQMKIRNRSK